MPDAPAPVPPPFSKVCLPLLPAGWQTVRHAILADGTLVVLATDVDLAGEHKRIFTAWQASANLEPPSRLNALAADGPWLVVAARSRSETNARLLAPDGALRARLMLGDEIEDVAIDAEERIWVGWLDKGCSGTAAGLCRAMSGRRPAWRGVLCVGGRAAAAPYMASEGWPIADCSALKVTGPGAWACPYTEFPLVRFVPGETARWWRNALASSKAMPQTAPTRCSLAATARRLAA